jgi:hypothetical protein
MKNPNLKLKYSKGLGDVMASFLHSTLIGWLTHLITGKKEPCQTCSERINALNVLFPIPVWKLFFKNPSQLLTQLSKDLTNAGYEVKLSDDGYTLNSFKQEDVNPQKIKKETNQKKLISTNNLKLDGFLIKTEVYKT